MHNKKISIIVSMVLGILLLAGCTSSFQADVESYMASMDDVHVLDSEYDEKMSQLEIGDLPETLSPRNEEIDMERLASLIETLDEEIMPIVTQMEEAVAGIEVSNEELAEIHESYLESLELKGTFVQQLSDYTETYYMSVRSNESLIQLSQTFMENQEERDAVIDSISDEAETEEMDAIVTQINENSTALEEEAEMLQQDESRAEKMEHIDEVMLPLINEHIQSLNEMNLETDKGVRVRSLTLEMYYGFEKYYEERKNTMQYNEQLQELQLQNILPLRETYQQLDQEYYDQLNEIESELS
ncbi:EMYY motif lipoprotein [Salinicoccus roseus]|uniref:EMYY motif lipoprotein n=1 Tax=Salinicoccus roseus TaxID=45670 RepID=UPI001CA7314D|nr:EMYY motif lipoprotein [Salinicoccus roseus]MBY8910296.1 EMYY motif lipoprotein [Salinicoccus roseus]